MTFSESEFEKVKKYFHPDLATNERADIWIEMASFRVSKCYFKGAYYLALALMAEHIGALEDRGSDGVAGAITSKREGDLSIGFAAGSDSDDLSATSYGREYQSLLKQYSPRPGVTGGAFPKLFCGGC